MEIYPTSDQIDPEKARFLFKDHCAILILENLPVGSEFGIDLTVYNIGEKFRGVKLIPPGIHFVFASAIDKSNHQYGPRTGFFHNFRNKELVVKRWSTVKEDFDDLKQPASIDQIERYKSNLEDLDRYLGVYNFSSYKTYLNLTNKITVDILDKLVPDCGLIRSVPYLTRETSSSSNTPVKRRVPRASLCTNPTDETVLPDLKPDKTTLIHFTSIPDNHKESDLEISAEMITNYNLDTTMKMKYAFGDHDAGRSRLLAELQFSFMAFLLCHVYLCFEQWKKLLQLVCKADEDLNKNNKFYADFAQILSYQLEQIPEDMFDDIVESNNLVRYLLEIFFQNLGACQSCDGDLKKSASELRHVAERKFGWQFDLEPEDERPVIVDL